MRKIGANPSRDAVAIASLGTLLAATKLQWMLGHVAAYRALYVHYPFWVPEGGKSTLQLALCVLVLFLIYRSGLRDISRELGMHAPVFDALVVAFVISLPLLFGLAASGALVTNLSWRQELYTGFYGNFAEDVVFTGFAFGQLYRRAGWPFWGAVIAVAVVFALGHVEKGTSIGQVLGIFAVTGCGQALLAWLFVRWGMNLWVPFSLHCFTDIWWDLFATGPTALGGALPLMFQLATAATAIALTARLRSRR